MNWYIVADWFAEHHWAFMLVTTVLGLMFGVLWIMFENKLRKGDWSK